MATPTPDAAGKKDKATAQGSSKKEKNIDLIGILTFCLVLINVVALGGLGYFMKNMWVQVDELKNQSQQIKLAQKQAETKAEETVVPERLQPQNLGVLYALEGFLINLTSKAGTKYLQTQIELELEDSAVEEEISRKRAVLRDAIIMLLSSRTYEALRKPKGMKELRKDILMVINNVLSTGRVQEIYFTRFHFN